MEINKPGKSLQTKKSCLLTQIIVIRISRFTRIQVNASSSFNTKALKLFLS